MGLGVLAAALPVQDSPCEASRSVHRVVLGEIVTTAIWNYLTWSLVMAMVYSIMTFIGGQIARAITDAPPSDTLANGN